MPKTLLALAAWCVLAAGARAGEGEERAREFLRLGGEVQTLFAAKDYQKAAETCRKMIELAPDQAGPHYNLACALARLGQAENALAALETSVAKGFTDGAHMEQDDDLASLRASERFKRCVARAKEIERAGGTYEPSEAIPGVRTFEGAPEGGLRYRLRMNPLATSESPDRLVIWLHPAGGSANQGVEPMSPRFVKLGFSLLVLTQKDWRSWSEADIRKLVAGTLPEVARIPGIDARRPILMGYSAGGQAAFMLWQQNLGKFGGLILDAAYPVRRTPTGFAVEKLPDDPAVKQMPFFVLVGEQDGGSKVWRQVAPAWLQAGVPLTVRYIPDKGHAWLFGPKQMDEILAWLGEVKAGKLPSDPVPPAAKPEEPPVEKKE